MTGELTRADIMRWRRDERQRLIAARMEVPAERRARWSDAIGESLIQAVGSCRDLVVSAYWPFRGEPDLRGLMARVTAAGGTVALPVVLEKGHPLAFRTWQEGEPLARGVWNIPIPAGGRAVVPDIAIAPVVGFDPNCYRLGYGGGFFDRTLAALAPRPRVFGVGYELQALPSIHPLAHDIAMNAIVTEAGLRCRPAVMQGS